MSREIEWDGRVWPSIVAAARSEGVSAVTMSNWLGLTAAQPKRRATLIHGVMYPSMADAARALGMSHSAIAGAVKRGTLDNVGLRKLRRMGDASGGPIRVVS